MVWTLAHSKGSSRTCRLIFLLLHQQQHHRLSFFFSSAAVFALADTWSLTTSLYNNLYFSKVPEGSNQRLGYLSLPRTSRVALYVLSFGSLAILKVLAWHWVPQHVRSVLSASSFTSSTSSLALTQSVSSGVVATARGTWNSAKQMKASFSLGISNFHVALKKLGSVWN